MSKGLESQPYCAESSSSVAEPLAGTAAFAELWVAIEIAHPWAAKPLESPTLSPRDREILASWEQIPGLRLQLIHRPSTMPGPQTLFIGRATPSSEWLLRFSIGDSTSLHTIDLAEIVRSGQHPNAVRVTHPVFLVCTHGKRDRCCAKWGMPVYSSISAIANVEVWQTSHLGGHRFAPTLVVLPEGYTYGRVEVSEVDALVASHFDGRVHDVDKLRGRSSYPPNVQAGEIELRRCLARNQLRGLEFLDEAKRSDEASTVRFASEGQIHSVAVKQVSIEPRRSSCKDDHDVPGNGFAAERI